MEMYRGLGFVRSPTKEPIGNEIALKAPRDVAQMINCQEKYSKTTSLSTIYLFAETDRKSPHQFNKSLDDTPNSTASTKIALHQPFPFVLGHDL